ncbi:MAG: metallophosphoesterase family protein [Parabacteroides sp.]|nr:metallophosphoesterase family protein [Parabacteroides sp.]
MKIAVFSDIHANIYAFRTALKDAEEHDVTHYIFLGDMITDLPWANEVYDIIRTLDNIKIIRGNRERSILELDQNSTLKNLHQFSSAFWTSSILSEANRAYISKMPDSLTFQLLGTNFVLNHRPEDIWGAEAQDCLHYFASSTESHSNYTSIMRKGIEKNPALFDKPTGIYLYGHYHGQWHGHFGNNLILNPGSCGMAGDNETRAEYSILMYDGGQWTVEERLVRYDKDRALREFRNSQLYQCSAIWSESVASLVETGLENLHLLFAHLNNVCSKLSTNKPFIPDEIWESEGLKWVIEYRKSIGLPLSNACQ